MRPGILLTTPLMRPTAYRKSLFFISMYLYFNVWFFSIEYSGQNYFAKFDNCWTFFNSSSLYQPSQATSHAWQKICCTLFHNPKSFCNTKIITQHRASITRFLLPSLDSSILPCTQASSVFIPALVSSSEWRIKNDRTNLRAARLFLE